MLAGLNVVDRYIIDLARMLRDVGCNNTAPRLN